MKILKSLLILMTTLHCMPDLESTAREMVRLYENNESTEVIKYKLATLSSYPNTEDILPTFFKVSQRFFHTLVEDYIEANNFFNRESLFSSKPIEHCNHEINILNYYMSICVYAYNNDSNLVAYVAPKNIDPLPSGGFVADTHADNWREIEEIKKYWTNKTTINEDFFIRMPALFLKMLGPDFFAGEIFGEIVSPKVLISMGIDKVNKCRCLWLIPDTRYLKFWKESYKYTIREDMFDQLYELDRDFAISALKHELKNGYKIPQMLACCGYDQIDPTGLNRVPYSTLSKLLENSELQLFADHIDSVAFYLISSSNTDTIVQILSLQDRKSINNLLAMILEIHLNILANPKCGIHIPQHMRNRIRKNFNGLVQLSDLPEEAKASVSNLGYKTFSDQYFPI